MGRAWWVAPVLVLASAGSALAQDKNLVGQEAPEIQTKEWIGSVGRNQIADYKGEVVLLEAFATW